jgi:hypothetical protein
VPVHAERKGGVELIAVGEDSEAEGEHRSIVGRQASAARAFDSSATDVLLRMAQ